MKENIPVLKFENRALFREWLACNSENSEGVWLIFGKKNKVKTLSAKDALEEALCYGWIDGVMKSIDDTMYSKYFSKRRPNSVWSQKNKQTIELLRKQGLMTEYGEKAIETAKEKGTWNDFLQNLTDEQIQEFGNKLKDYDKAFDNFNKLSPSTKLSTVRFYYSVKSEPLRERNFKCILDNLSK